MKWPARCAIHKVNPKGSLLIEGSRIISTNGALIVQIPFHGEAPDSHIVNSKAFGHAVKGRGKRDPTASAEWSRIDQILVLHAGDGSILGTPAERDSDSYPRPENVEEPNDFLTVRFSAEQLALAAEAMGTEYVELRIPRDQNVVSRPLVIRPRDGGRDGDSPLHGARAILGVST